MAAAPSPPPLIRAVLIGATGRMGQALMRAAAAVPGLLITRRGRSRRAASRSGATPASSPGCGRTGVPVTRGSRRRARPGRRGPRLLQRRARRAANLAACARRARAAAARHHRAGRRARCAAGRRGARHRAAGGAEHQPRGGAAHRAGAHAAARAAGELRHRDHRGASPHQARCALGTALALGEARRGARRQLRPGAVDRRGRPPVRARSASRSCGAAISSASTRCCFVGAGRAARARATGPTTGRSSPAVRCRPRSGWRRQPPGRYAMRGCSCL